MPEVATGTLTPDTGAPLVWHAWNAGPAPRAVLAVCHGFGEHARLPPFDALCSRMADAGIACVLFDAYGHGRSPGPRGHVPSRNAYDAAVRALRTRASAGAGGAPLVLLGMSAGTLPALRSAIEEPAGLAGVILVASPLGEVGASRMVLAVARVLGRVSPRLPFNPRLDLTNLSRDEGFAQSIASDLLFHQRATAGAVRYFVAEAAALRRDAARLSVPLLMLHGDQDRIAHPHTEVFERVPRADKTLRLYPGARHNLFAETNRDEVFADIADWIGVR
ncbi:MAG: alpha/beta fold hydrolase [Vicinamibacterales bacterium]